MSALQVPHDVPLHRVELWAEGDPGQGSVARTELLDSLLVVSLDLDSKTGMHHLLKQAKTLNSHDDLVLRNHGINVEAGEDVFRFHLMPDHNSDLPRITHSVLKTRSTLSLHKVYRYLIKKL